MKKLAFFENTKLLNGYGTFLAGSYKTAEKLFAIEFFSRFVFFNNHYGNAFNAFVGCESFLALQTFTATSY